MARLSVAHRLSLLPFSLIGPVYGFLTDEPMCFAIVAASRWPSDIPVCPRCGHYAGSFLSKQLHWKCSECRRQFSVKVGTFMEHSPLPIGVWLSALWIIVPGDASISFYTVSRALNMTQPSAWRVLRCLRLALGNTEHTPKAHSVVRSRPTVASSLPRYARRSVRYIALLEVQYGKATARSFLRALQRVLALRAPLQSGQAAKMTLLILDGC
jgi:hypothetical protein